MKRLLNLAVILRLLPFGATDLEAGAYTVTVQTNDGYGQTVECSTTITVR